MALLVTPRPLGQLKKLSGVVFDPDRNPSVERANTELEMDCSRSFA
jgi:hypothetical protein